MTMTGPTEPRNAALQRAVRHNPRSGSGVTSQSFYTRREAVGLAHREPCRSIGPFFTPHEER